GPRPQGRRRRAPFKLPSLLPSSLAIPRTASQHQVSCALLHCTGPIAAIGPREPAAGGSKLSSSEGAKRALALAGDRRLCSSRNIAFVEPPSPPTSNCGERSGGAERPLRSYPLVDWNSP